MYTHQPAPASLPTFAAKNKKQLAAEMGISLRTLQRRLKSTGVNVPRGLISPSQQKEIWERLGWNGQ